MSNKKSINKAEHLNNSIIHPSDSLKIFNTLASYEENERTQNKTKYIMQTDEDQCLPRSESRNNSSRQKRQRPKNAKETAINNLKQNQYTTMDAALTYMANVGKLSFKDSKPVFTKNFTAQLLDQIEKKYERKQNPKTQSTYNIPKPYPLVGGGTNQDFYQSEKKPTAVLSRKNLLELEKNKPNLANQSIKYMNSSQIQQNQQQMYQSKVRSFTNQQNNNALNISRSSFRRPNDYNHAQSQQILPGLGNICFDKNLTGSQQKQSKISTAIQPPQGGWNSKSIVQYIMQGKLVLNKAKVKQSVLIMKDRNNTRKNINQTLDMSKYDGSDNGSQMSGDSYRTYRTGRSKTQLGSKWGDNQSVRSHNSRGSRGSTSSRNIFRNTKESKELLDFIITVGKDNIKNIISANIKFGLLNNATVHNLKINIYNSECVMDLPWVFEQVFGAKETDSNKKIKLSQVANNWKFIKGKNVVINAPSIYHLFKYKQLSQNRQLAKDLCITDMLHKRYIKQPELNPTINWFSPPKIFEQNKNDFLLVQETDYFSSLESILEFRANLNKPWEEADLLNNFYQVLHSLNELEKQNLAHGNISTENMLFVYVAQRYKIFNFQNTQVQYPGQYKRYEILYNNYYQAPELRGKHIQMEKKKHNNKVLYNILAADMFAVGMVFLFMKFLITESQRKPDYLNEKLVWVFNDDSISSIIISSLLEDNAFKRTNNSFELLCRQIHQNLSHMKKFREIVVKSNLAIKALPPFQKNKYTVSDSEYDMSKYYFKTFQWQKSLEKIQKIQKMMTVDEADDEEYLGILNKCWKSYYKLEDYQNAIKYNKIYFEKLQNRPDSLSISLANDFQESGRLKWILEKYQEALKDFEQSLKILQSVLGKDDYEILLVLNNLGVLYQVSKQYEDTLRCLNQAVQIMKNKNQQDDLYIATHDNLASLYNETMNYDKGVLALQESLRIRISKDQDKNDPKISHACFNIATLLIKQRDYQKAKSYLNEAIMTREKQERYNESADLETWRKTYIELVQKISDKQFQSDVQKSYSEYIRSKTQESGEKNTSEDTSQNEKKQSQSPSKNHQRVKEYEEKWHAQLSVGQQNEYVQHLNNQVKRLKRVN